MDLNHLATVTRLPTAGPVPLTAANTTVVIGTFGDAHWHALAELRAVPSARQLGTQVVHVHADTLHEARNRGLDEVETEWVVFLDADDELEPDYLDAMSAGSADVRAPAVRYMRPGGRFAAARMPQVAGHTHACQAECLLQGNWLVIGSAVRADLVRKVGGFRDHPLYEDWCLWLRCYLAGATFEAVPAAIYRAHVRHRSRNRAPSPAEKFAAHRAIAEANGIGMP